MTDDATREAWAAASRKYEREDAELLEHGRSSRLLPLEERLLAPIVAGADVVHPMSGHGLEDLALARLGARSVIGLDYSPAAYSSAARRAAALGLPVSYRDAVLPATGLPAGCADLVYTGRGALPWVRDLDALLAEVRRVLRSGGRFFVFDAHPMEPLWTWDPDRIEVRDDRSYFAAGHVNDSFPAGGAVETQRTLAALVTAVLAAGFVIEHLEEHPEPFWRMGGVDAAAWRGRVPNTISLLARGPG